jgi:glycosyltransferase involved in cell wall biosynthesis
MTWAARALARAASDRKLRPAFWVLSTRRLSEATLMDGDVLYINVSHKALARIAQLRDELPRRNVRIVVMIHDLMPLTSPRFFPAALREQFAASMAAVSRSADLVIANSDETARDVGSVLASQAGPSIVVLPLGVRTAAVPMPAGRRAVPMFACLGAIEARKNVELLLRVWERMISTSTTPPQLVLVGEASADASLERQIDGLRPHVSVQSGLDDVAVAELLSGARALLFPSWAEGFGLPLVEALAAGIPVLCSDLPALREVGGDLPEFLPPHEPDAWLATIQEYAGRSPRRQAQLERIRGFRPPSWERHFAMLAAALSNLQSRAPHDSPG